MSIDITVYAGTDEAFIAWTAPFIPDCRGFALFRKIKHAPGSVVSPNALTRPDAKGFIEEAVASWVGFADDGGAEPGTRQPTTVWPIQKYLWSDFAVNPGDQVAYRAVPMTGPRKTLTQRNDLASNWSETVLIGPLSNSKLACYFNRGIVASQWVARHLPALPDPDKDRTAKGHELQKSIDTPGNEIRNFLSGPLRVKLVELLAGAGRASDHVYAALFELDDPELMTLLTKLGKRAHIVLGNGSVKEKGDDENSAARAALEGVCDIRDRFSAPRALAHNKFLVLCKGEDEPVAVWTGSTNWSKTGLCTQANNGLFINDKKFAGAYLDQWKLLAKAGAATPASLKVSNATPRKPDGKTGPTLWFTPMVEPHDLEQAGELIAGAKEGILFLMFNPGPRGTLLNDIIRLASPDSPDYKPDLYIQGVVNQDPGTKKNPVTLFNRGSRIDANEDVVLPAAIDKRLTYWVAELLKLPRAHAMVHSKVVIVDPFGKHPVVMTGSHNMGPRASGTNDENFVIVEGGRELAVQYATKIMDIYNQYRWRASQHATKQEPKWKGLADNDGWQIGNPKADKAGQAYDKRRLRELDFWFGKR